MDFANVVLALPEVIFDEFKTALQRGVWSNGMPLTPRQKSICREALLLRKGGRNEQFRLLH